VITRCDMRLSDFAELDAPAECSATITEELEDRHTHVSLALHQLDAQIGEAQVELAFATPPGTS